MMFSGYMFIFTVLVRVEFGICSKLDYDIEDSSEYPSFAYSLPPLESREEVPGNFSLMSVRAISSIHYYNVVATDIKKYPYIAQVTKEGRIFLCFGALISKLHVLTSAYCTAQKEHDFRTHIQPHELFVYLGVTWIPFGFEIHRVRAYTVHPDFHFNKENNWSEYDVAILRLQNPVEFTDNVYPVAVANRNEIGNMERFEEDRMRCETFVWNQIDPSDLTEMNIDMVGTNLIGKSECSRFYPEKKGETEVCGFSSMSAPPCRKNVGAPLVCKGKVYGMHLWTKTCGLVPDLFVRVDTLLEFVSLFVENRSLSEESDDKDFSCKFGNISSVVQINRDGYFVGNGVMLSTKHVLTSIHSVKQEWNSKIVPTNISIVIDSICEGDSASSYGVSDILQHPTYNGFNSDGSSDLNILMVILVVDQPVTDTPHFHPIKIPTKEELHEVERSGKYQGDCITIGWDIKDKAEHGSTSKQDAVIKSIKVSSDPSKCGWMPGKFCASSGDLRTTCVSTGAPIICGNKLYALNQEYTHCRKTLIVYGNIDPIVDIIKAILDNYDLSQKAFSIITTTTTPTTTSIPNTMEPDTAIFKDKYGRKIHILFGQQGNEDILMSHPPSSVNTYLNKKIATR